MNFRKIPGFLLFVAVAACAPRQTTIPNTPEALFQQAQELYQKGEYSRAAQLFQQFIFRYPTSGLADDAQFYLAESYFRQKDYDQAIIEYRFLIDNFPSMNYVPKAELRIAEAYLRKSPPPELDQTDTEQAIRLFRRFLARYPDSPLADTARLLLAQAKEKLAQKMLIAAVTYRNLKMYDAEKFYLDLLLREYPESQAAWQAKYYLAEYYLVQNQPDKATPLIYEIIEDSNASPSLIRKAKILGLKYRIWPFKKLETLEKASSTTVEDHSP